MEIKENTLHIAQDNVKKMGSEKFDLTDFDRNVKASMRMIEERNNKIKKEKEMATFDKNVKENMRMIDERNKQIERERQMKSESYSQKEKRERHKKNLKRRRIKAAIYVAAGIAIGTASYQTVEHVAGKNEIVSEFSGATASFGVRDDSGFGYIINEGNSYVSLEDGINRMVQSARDRGMNTQEIAIGLTSIFNKSVAIEAVGKDNYPSFSERNKMYESAYHESKINGLSQNIEKGNGK